MTRVLLPLGVVAAVVLLGVAGLYAYDRSHSEEIADGVTVAGVPVGGVTVSEARTLLSAEVAAPLEEPIRISAPGRDRLLTARRARLEVDVDGMARRALAVSRDGFFVVRAVRDLAGAEESTRLPAKVTYSRRAVGRVIAQVKGDVNRPARDATVEMSGTGVRRVKAQTGRRVDAAALSRAVRRRITRPGSRRVRVHAAVLKPKVLTKDVDKKYPHIVTVDRSGHTLRYYRNLKLKASYRIAVGQAGLETPAGKYSIQNKAVNPDWHVPDSDWAGDKAGQIIPGGTAENPLKARWMGIYDGAGIHGTDEVGSLGTNASHGCIRMAIPEVIELYKRVPVQTPIYIG